MQFYSVSYFCESDNTAYNQGPGISPYRRASKQKKHIYRQVNTSQSYAVHRIASKTDIKNDNRLYSQIMKSRTSVNIIPVRGRIHPVSYDLRINLSYEPSLSDDLLKILAAVRT